MHGILRDKRIWIATQADRLLSMTKGGAVVAISIPRYASPVLQHAGDVLVVETLVAALMASNRDNVAQAARLTEAISSSLS